RYSYDAWGKRRNPDTWAHSTDDVIGTTARGFTSHEMLDEVNLIHMNGRVYDPLLGRFNTPDPYLQEPGNSQNYARYSYVLNNPLSLTDPSGYFFKSIFRAIGNFFKSIFRAIGSIFKAVGKWIKKNWRMIVVIASTIVASVLTMGAMGAFAAGATTATLFSATIVAGAVGGFVNGAVSAAVAGGRIKDIFLSGFKGAAIGAVTSAATFGIGHGAGGQSIFSGLLRIGGLKVGEFVMKSVAHGLLQGTVSEIAGGDFMSGFIGGAIGSAVGAFVNGIKLGGTFGLFTRTAITAAAGGTAAMLGDGNFANGAISAAFTYLFNEALGAIRQLYDRLDKKTADTHYLHGKGYPVWAKLTRIKFDGATYEWIDHNRLRVSFPFGLDEKKYHDGNVYGTFTLFVNDQRIIYYGYDKYNFDYKHPWYEHPIRNIATWFAKPGKGTPYYIHLYENMPLDNLPGVLPKRP
ncbi:MAG: hypothetical protein NZM04_06730, partial [Methylacidiphilales bacterium]|nr:hypothetical protein [Candidatus Methylacidiphilales bacterium]